MKETEETVMAGEALKEKAMSSDKSGIHIFKKKDEKSFDEPESGSEE